MKIAAFHNLPSGGALKVWAEKMRLLKKAGHEIQAYIFSTADADFVREEYRNDRTQVIPLQFRGPRKFKRYDRASLEAAQRINASDADCVLADKCQFIGTPRILKYLEKPSVFYSHEPLRFKEYEKMAPGAGNKAESEKIFLKNAFRDYLNFPKIMDHFRVRAWDRENIHCANHVLTNSKFTAEWIQRVYGVTAEVLYQGIDAEFYNAGANIPKKNQVLSVGRLSRVKGYSFLADVFASLPAEKRPLWQIVYDDADPEYASELMRKLKACHIPFEFHCRVSERELRFLYQESQLVLCASQNEPFGMVPLEAMACGIPVIAVREGGFPETIRDGETGYLLSRDISEWQSKITRLLADDQTARQLGAAGRLWAESRWTWDSFTDKLTAIFLKTVSARKNVNR